MLRQLKEIYQKPSAETLALRELEDAKRNWLEALSGAEYARRMAEYHNDRIKRLTAYLRDNVGDDK